MVRLLILVGNSNYGALPSFGSYSNYGALPTFSGLIYGFLNLSGYGKSFCSCNGKFLSAQPNGTLQWNRDRKAEWESFELINIGGNQFSIRTYHGKFVCAEKNGTVVCNRVQAKEWERFQIEPIPG
jgi:hypothetical protein